MKRFFALLLAAVLSLALCACGAKPEGDAPGGDFADLAPVTLIGADSAGKGAAGELLGRRIAEKAAAYTNGKLTVDYFPNGELGNDADLLRQTCAGDVSFVICQTAPVVSFVPEMAVFDLPMAFARHDGDTIERALNGGNSAFRAALDDAYARSGLHLLGFLQNGTYRMTTSNTPLRTLDDFRGLQIRTMENANHMAFWRALGAEPTPLAWSEVYFSLKCHGIDAQENAADTCLGTNFQEVQSYLCATKHILYVNQIAINADTYQSLDPRYRDAFDRAVADACAELRESLAQIDADSVDALIAGGMTQITYDEAFFEAVLALNGVQELYRSIDAQTNGLAALLTEALNTAA